LTENKKVSAFKVELSSAKRAPGRAGRSQLMGVTE